MNVAVSDARCVAYHLGRGDQPRCILEAGHRGPHHYMVAERAMKLLQAVVQCADDGALNGVNFSHCRKGCECVICAVRAFLRGDADEGG